MHGFWGWIIFGVSVFIMLAMDLGVFQKREHEIKLKEAIFWSVVWTLAAFIFNYVLYLTEGKDAALKFLAAYILERSLSVDNLFVFLLIFSYFGIPAKYQHKVLFWGILGALVMRAVFIFGGIALIKLFSPVIYVFGVILVWTGVKLFFEKGKEVEPDKNILIRGFKRLMPVNQEVEHGHFFTRQGKVLFATPIFVALLAIEISDVVFAVDSIPAVLAISVDPFIVYSSNIFAILGLRALYFAIAGLMKIFYYLHYGLSIILVLIGVKMLISGWVHIPIELALALILGVLTLSIVASILWPRKEEAAPGTKVD